MRNRTNGAGRICLSGRQPGDGSGSAISRQVAKGFCGEGRQTARGVIAEPTRAARWFAATTAGRVMVPALPYRGRWQKGFAAKGGKQPGGCDSRTYACGKTVCRDNGGRGAQGKKKRLKRGFSTDKTMERGWMASIAVGLKSDPQSKNGYASGIRISGTG